MAASAADVVLSDVHCEVVVKLSEVRSLIIIVNRLYSPACCPEECSNIKISIPASIPILQQ